MPQHPLVPVEPLEPRRLCAAASVALVDHVLTVVGNGTQANTITVGVSANGGGITATVTYAATVAAAGHPTATYPLPQTIGRTFPLDDDIRAVSIHGGSGADLITIDQTNGSFTVPVTVRAGAGDDTVIGGDESDRFYGGPGEDSLVGGAGNDTLFGQDGDDVLVGGAGNDYLSGGNGFDSLVGGDGNDTLNDPFGPDTVLGGAGHNVFSVHSLRADVHNDYNPNTDKLNLLAVPGTASSGFSLGGLLGNLFPVGSFL